MLQDITGSQRDLLDYVTIVDAIETPFTSMVPKGPAPDNVLMEWPVDTEETPTDNKTIEGTDVTDFDNAEANYAVLSNRVQWFREKAMVGKLAQDLQNQAGIKNKKAYAIRKKLEQLKRDIEVRMCSDSEAVVGTGTVANETRGVGKWIQATAQSLYPVPTAFRPASASIYTDTIANLTESAMQTVLTSQYNATGQNRERVLLVGTTLKRTITDFTRTQFGSTNVASSVRTYNTEVSTRRITSVIDRFVGDFGAYEIVPSLWLNWLTGSASDARRGYALDMTRWQIAFKQQARVTELPDLGGGPRFLCDAICGLRCLSPRDQAKFASTS